MSATLPSIDAIVATKGRAEIVARLVAYLREQTLPLDVFVISTCDPSDVTGVAETSSATRIVFGSAGSSAQRNNGLSALPADIDIVVFLDDDFIPSRFWLTRVRDIFVASPDIAIVSGKFLTDGIKTAGMPWDEGENIVRRADAAHPNGASYPPLTVEDFSPYGCNMAFRRTAIGNERFDEWLVLYAWQEDRDFGARERRC